MDSDVGSTSQRGMRRVVPRSQRVIPVGWSVRKLGIEDHFIATYGGGQQRISRAAGLSPSIPLLVGGKLAKRWSGTTNRLAIRWWFRSALLMWRSICTVRSRARLPRLLRWRYRANRCIATPSPINLCRLSHDGVARLSTFHACQVNSATHDATDNASTAASC